MSSHPTVLAVDVGTSSVRALEFEATGRVLSQARRSYPVVSRSGGLEEQDPDLVWARVQEAIGEALVDPSRVAALAFSSQMYGVFGVDGSGRPLGPNLLWSDARAAAEATAARAELDGEAVARTTGCPISSIYPRYKLRWLSAHEPEQFTGAAHFVSIKDYVLFQLTGEWTTDPSLASASGLLDIGRLDWDPEALAWAGVSADRLPRIVPGASRLPLANTALRDAWGLGPEVVVVPGGGDGPLANIGSGASGPGEVNIDLGTSGAARVVLDHLPERSAGLWCYCLADGLWVQGGILTNVGNAWDWACTSFIGGGDEAFAQADALLASAAPGADGLLFLPFLRAPRSPYWDDSLSGTLHGLRPAHGTGHILRALAEALGYDLAVVLGLLAGKAGLRPPLRLTGGLVRNRTLTQVIADVTGRELVVPGSSEGSAAGAAILGLRALGLIDGLCFSEPDAPAAVFSPDPAWAGVYRDGLVRYQALVAHMRQLPDLAGAE